MSILTNDEDTYANATSITVTVTSFLQIIGGKSQSGRKERENRD